MFNNNFFIHNYNYHNLRFQVVLNIFNLLNNNPMYIKYKPIPSHKYHKIQFNLKHIYSTLLYTSIYQHIFYRLITLFYHLNHRKLNNYWLLVNISIYHLLILFHLYISNINPPLDFSLYNLRILNHLFLAYILINHRDKNRPNILNILFNFQWNQILYIILFPLLPSMITELIKINLFHILYTFRNLYTLYNLR